jgi:hypothetical protein
MARDCPWSKWLNLRTKPVARLYLSRLTSDVFSVPLLPSRPLKPSNLYQCRDFAARALGPITCPRPLNGHCRDVRGAGSGHHPYHLAMVIQETGVDVLVTDVEFHCRLPALSVSRIHFFLQLG